MTIRTSRRAILAGAAALPALAMPAIADLTPDPIYAAIDAHRAAYRAFSDILNRKSALEDQHPDLVQENFPGIMLGKGLNYEIADSVEVPVHIRTQKDVTDLMRRIATMSRAPARAEREKFEALWRAQLRKKAADYKADRKAAGLDAMERAEDDYGSRETDAANFMLSCQPTTRAGLVAYLAYVVEFQVGRGDYDEMELALQTAAAAAKALT
jgi:hypothetical protein